VVSIRPHANSTGSGQVFYAIARARGPGGPPELASLHRAGEQPADLGQVVDAWVKRVLSARGKYLIKWSLIQLAIQRSA
jgi:hypothetical protein